MRTIDDTGLAGIRLIQDTGGFRYGIDAVLLTDYAKMCAPRARQAVELGCGNGIVSLVLAGQSAQRHVTGIEFQEAAVQLAQQSCALNHLEDRVRFLCCDVVQLREEHPDLGHTADLVVSNPPYIARGSGIPGDRQQLHSARQETTADLEDFIAAASWLLQDKGTFCLVHRPFRLVDIFYFCRKHGLEPKRIRFIHPREGQPPNILLLQCVRGGGRELVYDPPLYVYDTEGAYTQDIVEIYEKT